MLNMWHNYAGNIIKMDLKLVKNVNFKKNLEPQGRVI